MTSANWYVIQLALFVVLYVSRKLWTKSEFVPVASMDFAGAQLRRDIPPRTNWFMKVWDWLE